MLNLVTPLALGFLGALVPVVFFYFLRMKFRRQPVSSTYLWQKLVKVNEGGARLRWRSWLLLVLQVLVVLALGAGLTGLEWVGQKTTKPGTVYVLDVSASMGSRETAGIRLDLAKKALLEDLLTLPQGTPVAVFLASDELRPLVQNRVFDAQDGELAGRLGAVSAGTAGFSEAHVADALAAWLQTRPEAWSGVLLTDGGVDLGGGRLFRAFESRIRVLSFAGPAPNLGLVSLTVGDPTGSAGLGFFNGFPSEKRVVVVLSRDGVERARREVNLPTGSSQQQWELSPAENLLLPGVWKAELVGNHDALSADDSILWAVNPPRQARILHAGETDPFLKAAFPGASYQESSGTETPDEWDIAVGSALVPGWKGNLITFGALPPGAPVFWGPPVSGTLTPASDHPLSRWVGWAEVRVEGGRSLGVKPGATVLAEAGGWPVAVTWETDGVRFLALGFDVFHSNFGLTAALPILMKNFRQACVPQEANPLTDNLRVGVPVLRAGSANGHLEGSSARSGISGLRVVRRGTQWELTALEAGTFRWSDGAQTVTLVGRLPAAESDTAPRALAVAGAASSPVSHLKPKAEELSLVGWLALVTLALLIGEWWLWNGRLERKTNPGLAALRLGAITAALLAIAGVSAPLPTSGRNLTLLFDVSASLGPELAEKERAAAVKLVEGLDATDRVAIITFAGSPRVDAGLEPRQLALTSLAAVSFHAQDDNATDVQAALAAGAQLLERQPGSSAQYLFTDGRANRGGDLAHLAPGPFPVSAVPLGQTLEGVVLQGLDLPSSARPGEAVRVVWRGQSEKERSLKFSLVIDGQTVALQTATVGTAGAVAFSFVAGQAGTQKVEVSVADEGGRPLPSAGATAPLDVEGRNAVLVVQRSPSSVAPALMRQGFPVLTRAPKGLPNQAAGYQGLSAVVLDNVPATSLTADQQQTLQQWVAGGGGLLVIGGDASLGRGEYFDSKLEDLLPVQTDTRRRLQFTRTRVLFVVDHSGSMSDDVGQTTKLRAAVGGITQTLQELTAQDEVGILQFDTTATWVLPFTPVTKKATVLAALDSFSEGGGTDLAVALEEAVRAFSHPGPVKRQVILMTDGLSPGEDPAFRAFAERMRAAQVSVGIVGIGNEVNDTLLESLASRSGGVYYHAQGEDLPTILHKETVRVTRELLQEGTFVPLAVGNDPLQDVGGTLPPVRGYLVTQAKPLSRTLWEVERPDGGRDPLLADWRYGAGRVAVFASDSGSRWLKSWSGLAVLNRFWGQTVRSLETPDRDRNLKVAVKVSASVARVAVEALDAGRLKTGSRLVARSGNQTFALGETAPGEYQASIPVEQGLSLITVSDEAGSGRTWAWAWNPSGSELAQGGADWAGLGHLTSTTGGLLWPLAGPQPPTRVWTWALADLRGWWLLAALMLFLVELGWRSTSLGQLALAKAQFLEWWSSQRRPWVKPTEAPVVRGLAEQERRTQDAYRYLASRHRKSV